MATNDKDLEAKYLYDPATAKQLKWRTGVKLKRIMEKPIDTLRGKEVGIALICQLAYMHAASDEDDGDEGVFPFEKATKVLKTFDEYEAGQYMRYRGLAEYLRKTNLSMKNGLDDLKLTISELSNVYRELLHLLMASQNVTRAARIIPFRLSCSDAELTHFIRRMSTEVDVIQMHFQTLCAFNTLTALLSDKYKIPELRYMYYDLHYELLQINELNEERAIIARYASGKSITYSEIGATINNTSDQEKRLAEIPKIDSKPQLPAGSLDCCVQLIDNGGLDLFDQDCYLLRLLTEYEFCHAVRQTMRKLNEGRLVTIKDTNE